MKFEHRIPQTALSVLLVAALCIAGCGQEDGSKTAGQRKAQAREMVQAVMNAWDWKTWNQLLAEDVVLSLNVGSVGLVEAVGGETTIRGRDEAKSALKEFYGDLKKNVSFWGEIAEEYQVALLGDLRVLGDDPEQKDEIPFLAYLRFNEAGKVEQMTLATVDARPLVDALKRAVQEPK